MVGPLIEAVALAALAMTSVGLWTVRVALTARGRVAAACTVAAVEALAFALAAALDELVPGALATVHPAQTRRPHRSGAGRARPGDIRTPCQVAV